MYRNLLTCSLCVTLSQREHFVRFGISWVTMSEDVVRPSLKRVCSLLQRIHKHAHMPQQTWHG